MRESPSTALGRVIAEIRKEKGLKQEQLAEKAGLHETYISHIESGNRNPPWPTVVKISRALGVSIAELGDRAEGRKANTHKAAGQAKGKQRQTRRPSRPRDGKPIPRLPPPFADTELRVLSSRERKVLKMRFGLTDGRTYVYREIGEACDLDKSGARRVEKDALRKIKKRRDPSMAWEAGVRMVKVEKAILPVPGPDEKGGVARRTRYKAAPLTGGWGMAIGKELQEAGLRVFGEDWNISRRYFEFPQQRAWVVFCEEAGQRRIAAVKWRPGILVGPFLLGVIPANCDDPAVITNWLWRIAIEQQWGSNSLAFLVGGLSILLADDTRFRSPDALVSAILDTEDLPTTEFSIPQPDGAVAAAVLDGLTRLGVKT
ncbi:MAG: helix-turn-helix domain-containing protein [Solirubrobacterales bacterium]